VGHVSTSSKSGIRFCTAAVIDPIYRTCGIGSQQTKAIFEGRALLYIRAPVSAQVKDSAYACPKLRIDNLDHDQLATLLNEQHSVKDWYSVLESFSTAQPVNAQEFEQLWI